MSGTAAVSFRGTAALKLRGSAMLLALCACSVGQGEGFVHSDDLQVRDCYRGPFDLSPDFFAANPFENTLTIRMQRGEQDILVSDGLTLLVNDVKSVRSGPMNRPLPLGLPVGVSPLGFPLPDVPTPPAASLSLYLNDSCRSQNSLLMAYEGTVTFESLFSGDLNEENSQARITKGSLSAWVIDPRWARPRSAADAADLPDAGVDAGPGTPAFVFPRDQASHIDAQFNFIFHRGTPAQPFP